MYHFRSNPPCRQVRPAPAYVPTFYPLPAVGEAIAPDEDNRRLRCASVNVRPAPWVAPVRMSNDRLLSGLAQYLASRPAIDEAMLGRLFAKDAQLLPDMRRGRELPDRLAQRMSAFVAREVANA